LAPAYAQKPFPIQEQKNHLHLVASNDGREGSIEIHTDAELYAANLEKGASVEHSLHEGKYAWLQVARGSLTLNGTPMQQGDGAAVSDEPKLKIEASEDAEFLLFDLA
jgi:redox-sensitive bicupin YhaK (pirin superfamily)